jgi:hypothetical protein
VSSLTSTNHHLNPNPLSKHPHATFFSGEPAEPPPPAPIVVGAEETVVAAPEPIQRAIIVGHTGDWRPKIIVQWVSAEQQFRNQAQTFLGQDC